MNLLGIVFRSRAKDYRIGCNVTTSPTQVESVSSPAVSVLSKTLEKLASDTKLLFCGKAPKPLVGGADDTAGAAGAHSCEAGAGAGAARTCTRYSSNRLLDTLCYPTTV